MFARLTALLVGDGIDDHPSRGAFVWVTRVYRALLLGTMCLPAALVLWVLLAAGVVEKQSPMTVLVAVFGSIVFEQILGRAFTARGWSAAELVLQGVAARRAPPASSLGFDVGRQAMRERGNEDAWLTSLGILGAGSGTAEGRRGAAQTVVLCTMLPVAAALGVLLGVWAGEPFGAWERVGWTLGLATGFAGVAACAALGIAEVVKGRL